MIRISYKPMTIKYPAYNKQKSPLEPQPETAKPSPSFKGYTYSAEDVKSFKTLFMSILNPDKTPKFRDEQADMVLATIKEKGSIPQLASLLLRMIGNKKLEKLDASDILSVLTNPNPHATPPLEGYLTSDRFIGRLQDRITDAMGRNRVTTYLLDKTTNFNGAVEFLNSLDDATIKKLNLTFHIPFFKTHGYNLAELKEFIEALKKHTPEKYESVNQAHFISLFALQKRVDVAKMTKYLEVQGQNLRLSTLNGEEFLKFVQKESKKSPAVQ